MRQERAMARAWAEVDEDALKHNYALACSLCGPETQMICVVKANAYGLGLGRTVRTLTEAGASFFAVAAPEEALAVRREAKNASVLLMGPAEESYLPALIRENIFLTVGTLADGQKAARAAQAAGKPARVHVKLDTGLHRLGFADSSEALKLLSLTGLEIAGVYSHLALRSEAQSREQKRLFDRMTAELAAGGMNMTMRHLLDSIGLTRYPDWQMDAVRVGAFLYGNMPPGWERFSEGKNVLTFRTRVTRVQWVKAGEGVGYDETPLPRDTWVATLSAGYVDGYPRCLSGKGFVALHGKRAPVLGLVCMDQMMVDVTDIPETREGDTATLLGGDIDLRAYAAWGQLNRNECLALIGRRVPRVYLRAGKIAAVNAEMDDGAE